MLLTTMAFIFAIGLAVGSFINVVIYRTLSDESPFKGRSHCDQCDKPIAWYDNIPLVSFIILKGKCRHCHHPISAQYPIIELLTGILFVWWYGVGFAFFQLTQQPLTYIQPLFWLIVGLMLLIIAVTDAVSSFIPDYAVIILGGLALVYRMFLISTGIMRPVDFYLAILSGIILAAFFSSIIIGTKGKGMGWGDVKFALAMGLILGWTRLIVAVFSAFILGAIVGLVLISIKKKRFGQTIPFGPFLVIGTAIGLIWGTQLWSSYIALLV